MPRLLMLTGISASGKTTHAKYLVSRKPVMGEPWVRVSKDVIRSTNPGLPEKKVIEEEILTAKAAAKPSNRLSIVPNIVVDDTNLTHKHIVLWKKVAKDIGYDFSAKAFKVGLPVALERNRLRPEQERLPAVAIISQMSKVEPLGSHPDNKALIVVLVSFLAGLLGLILGNSLRNKQQTIKQQKE